MYIKLQYVWPWSYNKCGAIDHLDEKQEMNACVNEPGFGMHPYQGRGAPEIGINIGTQLYCISADAACFYDRCSDIFEVMPGHEMPGSGPVDAFMSSSLQVAPGIPKTHHRPVNGKELDANHTW